MFEDFGRLVRELRNSRFGQALLKQDSLAVIWRGATDTTPNFRDFDEEDFRSFLLGCRMLLQKNDRLSLENVWRIAVDIDDPKGEWLVRMNRARTPYILHEMNVAPFPDHEGNELTFEHIVKVFLYGQYAHSDEKKRAVLRRWERSPQTLILMKQMFAVSMKLLLERAEAMVEEIEAGLETGDFSAEGSICNRTTM